MASIGKPLRLGSEPHKPLPIVDVDKFILRLWPEDRALMNSSGSTATYSCYGVTPSAKTDNEDWSQAIIIEGRLTVDGPKLMVTSSVSKAEKWGRVLKVIRSIAIYTIVLFTIMPFAGGTSSAGADDLDMAQVVKTLKALELRVASLEFEKTAI